MPLQTRQKGGDFVVTTRWMEDVERFSGCRCLTDHVGRIGARHDRVRLCQEMTEGIWRFARPEQMPSGLGQARQAIGERRRCAARGCYHEAGPVFRRHGPQSVQEATLVAFGKRVVAAVAADQNGNARVSQPVDFGRLVAAQSGELFGGKAMRRGGGYKDVAAPQPVVLGHPDQIRRVRPGSGVFQEYREGPAAGSPFDAPEIGSRPSAGCDGDIGIGRCDWAAGPRFPFARVGRPEGQPPGKGRTGCNNSLRKRRAERFSDTDTLGDITGLAVSQHPDGCGRGLRLIVHLRRTSPIVIFQNRAQFCYSLAQTRK